MSRAIIIHRRDLGNVVYSSNHSYKPPNDNATIDDYGNTTSAISVPVRFPDMIRTGNRDVAGSTFVWAGNIYNVKSITTKNVSAAFNLPNDITDARLVNNPEYKIVEPYFSVNITANTSSIYASKSSIPSLAQQTLVITIPVYKESDYRKLRGTLQGGIVEYSPPEDANRQQLNNFSEFNDSEFYGVISTQPTSNEQMIQIIPKKFCVIPDAKTIPQMKQKWNYICPSNSRQLSRTDIVCRMKNTSEIAGYNQGIITFYTNSGTNNTNFTENTRILRFRSIPFTDDPNTPSNVPLQTPDGIPVQIEGEGSDGTIQNFRVVVDEPMPSLSLTDTGVLVYSLVVIAIGLFIIMNLRSQFSNVILLLLLVLICAITIPVIIFSSQSSIKGFSLVWVSVIAVISLVMMGISTFVPERILNMLSGSGIVILLFLFSVFTFVSSWMLSMNKAEDPETNRKEYYLGYLLSNLPKVFIIGILFFSNPITNLLAFTSILSGKKTSFSLEKGVEKILNNPDSIDFTDSDIAKLLPSIKLNKINDYDNVITTQVNDTVKRVYYSKIEGDPPITSVRSGFGHIEGSEFKFDGNSESPGDDGYEFAELSPTDLIGFTNINRRVAIGIVALLIFAISLIFAQPVPVRKDEPDRNGQNNMIDVVVSTVLSVVILIMIVYMKYTQQIGWIAVIPFTIAIIVNIVSNWTLYGAQ